MNVRSPLTVSRRSGLHRQAGRTDRVSMHMRPKRACHEFAIRARTKGLRLTMHCSHWMTVLVCSRRIVFLLSLPRFALDLAKCRGYLSPVITFYTIRCMFVDLVPDVMCGYFFNPLFNRLYDDGFFEIV